jgi:RHS repeat-associated protein
MMPPISWKKSISQEMSLPGRTVSNPFRYAGREFDPETGIYQYRMRYYDQNVGRFLSEDP